MNDFSAINGQPFNLRIHHQCGSGADDVGDILNMVDQWGINFDRLFFESALFVVDGI